MESSDKVDEITDSQDNSATSSNSDEKEQIEEEQIDEEEHTKEPSTVERNVGKTLRDGMDDNNKKAFDVLKTGGENAFLKHVFTREDGTQRSYAEMRYLYG